MIPSHILRHLLLNAAGAATLAAASFPPDLLKKPDTWFDSPEGKKVTACVLSWQTEGGAWPKNDDTTKAMNPSKARDLEGTFDNKATTDELRYLAHAWRATKDKEVKAAFDKGFDCIIKAQYPNGGWPQLYPLGKKGYPHHITFNDNSTVRLLQFLGEVATSEDYAFMDAKSRAAAAKAIDKGVECIVKCQIVINGKPTVWCAQHDEVTLAPAQARAYELPSLSGSESAGIVRYLMTIKQPTPDTICCVKAAVAWFDSSKITGFRYQRGGGGRTLVADSSAPPLWARFYDLKDGRPFFCDRDGVKKYDLMEIGEERRDGYAWYGNWGESVAKDFAKWPHR